MLSAVPDRGHPAAVPGPQPGSILIPRGAVLIHPDTIHLMCCGDDETLIAVLIELALTSANEDCPVWFRYEATCRCGHVVEQTA